MADDVESGPSSLKDRRSSGKAGSFIQKYKWPLIIGGAVVLVLIILVMRNRNASSSTGSQTTSTPDTSSQIDPNTGIPYSSEYAGYGGGYSSGIGSVGPEGPAGPAGPAGPVGIAGATGATGAKGATGKQGPPGKPAPKPVKKPVKKPAPPKFKIGPIKATPHPANKMTVHHATASAFNNRIVPAANRT